MPFCGFCGRILSMEPGVYALVLHLEKELSITVGKLGTFLFPSGYYVYCGSALNGLSGRIKHHLRRSKRPHWHIDYLLQSADVVDIWYARAGQNRECSWCEAIGTMPNARIIIPGFGSSDCSCTAHLIYFTSQPSFDKFHETLKQRYAILALHLPPPRTLDNFSNYLFQTTNRSATWPSSSNP